MNKIDSLLKKIDTFHKLAVYSDRKEFLRVISQAAPLSEDIIAGIKSVVANLDINVHDEDGKSVQKRLQAFIEGFNTDLKQLADALREASHRLPDINQAKIAEDLANSIQDKIKTPKNETVGPTETVKEQIISSYPIIDKEEQEALYRIATFESLISVPLNPDGKLGPKTKAVIEAFKKKFNMSGMSDKNVLSAAKMMADTDPKYKFAE